MKLLVAVGVFAVSLGWLGCNALDFDSPRKSDREAEAEEAEPPSWTLLYYLAADNEEEGYADTTLGELQAATAGAANHPTILVLIDRLSTSGTEIYEVVSGELVSVSSAEEQDTSDPQTLQDFVTQGLTQFALENVAVIFKSEGLSWRGIGRDNTHDPEAEDMLMSTGDAAAALIAAQAAAQDDIDVLVFEGSKMAFAEVVYEVRHAAPILVTTQMKLLPDGIPWEPTIGDLVADPSMSAEALATAIVNNHTAYYAATGNGGVPGEDDSTDFACMTAIDTSYAVDMKDAHGVWFGMAGELMDDLWNILPHARDRAELGGMSHVTDADFQTDVFRFMSETIRLADDPLYQVPPLPQEFRDATDAYGAVHANLIIAEAHADKLHSATGVGMWFPPTWNTYNVDELVSGEAPNPPSFGSTIRYDDPDVALDWVVETDWVDFLFQWFDRAADTQNGIGRDEAPKPGQKE